MYRLIFSLIFFFSLTLCEIVVFEKQKDRIYRGHVLFEISMPMWSLCAQFCSRVQLCKSINFIAWNKTCQINDAQPEDGTKDIIESAGNSFVAASTFPKALAGPCKGHGCQLSEVCIPQATTYSCIPLLAQLAVRNKRYPTADDFETKQPHGPSQRSKPDVRLSSTHISTAERLPTITEKTTDAIDISTFKLVVNNGFYYGHWSDTEFCAQGHFAIGYSMKIEAYQGVLDDTALNAIRLQCGKPHWTGSRNYGSTVIGVEGRWGGWTSSQLCPYGEVMVSFSLQVEQKIIGDKTAANYVRFKCRYIGSGNLGTVLGGSGKWGSYGAWSGYCTEGSAICGLQVKMEPSQGISIDDTSLNDVIFCCCKNQL